MNSGFPTHQLYEKESIYETYIYKKGSILETILPIFQLNTQSLDLDEIT
jgi:hypothetical protein